MCALYGTEKETNLNPGNALPPVETPMISAPECSCKERSIPERSTRCIHLSIPLLSLRGEQTRLTSEAGRARIYAVEGTGAVTYAVAFAAWGQGVSGAARDEICVVTT